MMAGIAIGIIVGLVGSSGLFLYDYVDDYAREHYDEVDEDTWFLYASGVVVFTFAMCYLTFSTLIGWWYY